MSNTTGASYDLVGFFPLRPRGATFMWPVFGKGRDSTEWWTQVINDERKIVGFAPVAFQADEIRGVSRSVQTEPGRDALYAFWTNEEILICDTFGRFSEALREIIPSLQTLPFLQLEVAELLEDFGLANNATAHCSRVLAKQSVRAAEAWFESAKRSFQILNPVALEHRTFPSTTTEPLGEAAYSGATVAGRYIASGRFITARSPIDVSQGGVRTSGVHAQVLDLLEPLSAEREELVEQWSKVCDRLRKEIGDKAFKTWFGEVEPGESKDGKVRLYAPSRFVRDWVSRHYGDRVLAYWHAVDGEVSSVEVNLVPPAPPRRPNDIIAMPPAPQSYQQPMPRLGPAVGGADDGFSGPEARYTFANFVVGKPNEFAYAAARNIAEQDKPLPERNPLYIFGGVGLGKTHLMHAIWHAIRERAPKTRVLYLTAESFVNRFINALRTRNTGHFKDLLRNVDVLMVDDVQFICGKEASQDEFFFTFNSLVEQNKQIVLSSEKPPSELQDIEERMRARLGSGLVADIHSSTYELRLSILQTKAETSRVPVPTYVLEFLARKISANLHELEGALNRVVAHGQLIGREITVDMAQDVLHDLLRQADRKVTVDEIQQRVAAHYNIKLAEMSSPRRARSVARPRQVAMYLAKQLTTLSLPQIGKRFGNRDSNTVLLAIRRIEELKATDASIAKDIELLKQQLQG